MKKFLFTLALAACLFPPRAASALCQGLGLQGVPGTVTFQGGTGEYSVFDPAEYMQTANFTVAGGGALGTTCTWFITLAPGSSGNPSQRRMARGATTLDYNVYTTAGKANILKDITTAGGVNEIIPGSFPNGAGQTSPQTLYWTITPSQVVAAGASRFQDTTLNLILYEGILLGVYLPTDTKTITFQAKAESSVDLSLVDTGGAFNSADTAQTVSFGNMYTGQSLSYDTVIRSNDGYRVTLQSQNSQTLKHQTAATTVPYAVTFGGGNVNLTSGTAVQAASSAGTVTTAAGTRFSTAFTIGAMTGAEDAGNYQDILTVTVSAH